MKISVKPKLGWLHARAGKVVTVAHDHQVSVTSYDPNGDSGRQRRTFDTKWMTARVGDVAFEIVGVKAGKVLGHSYISGDATALNRYGDCPPHWFAPTAGWRVEFPVDGEASGKTHGQMIAAILRCKYAPDPCRIVVFELVLPTHADDPTGDQLVKRVAEWFMQAYQYEPADSDPGMDPQSLPPEDALVRHAHVLAHLHSTGKKGCHVGLHFQPPAHASAHAAQLFQTQLLLASVDLERVDVFDQDGFETLLYPEGLPQDLKR